MFTSSIDHPMAELERIDPRIRFQAIGMREGLGWSLDPVTSDLYGEQA